MTKFKVGDKVIIKRGKYGITHIGSKGKILGLDNNSASIKFSVLTKRYTGDPVEYNKDENYEFDNIHLVDLELEYDEERILKYLNEA